MNRTPLLLILLLSFATSSIVFANESNVDPDAQRNIFSQTALQNENTRSLSVSTIYLALWELNYEQNEARSYGFQFSLPSQGNLGVNAYTRHAIQLGSALHFAHKINLGYLQDAGDDILNIGVTPTLTLGDIKKSISLSAALNYNALQDAYTFAYIPSLAAQIQVSRILKLLVEANWVNNNHTFSDYIALNYGVRFLFNNQRSYLTLFLFAPIGYDFIETSGDDSDFLNFDDIDFYDIFPIGAPVLQFGMRF